MRAILYTGNHPRAGPRRAAGLAKTGTALDAIRLLGGLLVLGVLLALAGPPALPRPSLAADRMEPLPKELEGVGITEHLGARLPLDLEFTDEQGRFVRLGEYFRGTQPVILNLAYYECPMLCTLVLNGVTEGLKGLPWTLGKEYRNVTVSINPAETPELALLKQKTYLEEYGRPGAGDGWHFLTGRQEAITALAQAVGFGYRYDAENDQYIHTAATFICTPDGRLSRYLYGIEYEQQTLKMALLEASQGKLGNSLDQLVLYCFHYDANSGRYALAATRIMSLGGGLVVVVLGGMLVVLWRRDARRRKQGGTSGGVPS